MYSIYNCHAHVFTKEIVAERFLPFSLVRFLMKYDKMRWMARFLHKVLPFRDNDVLDRYSSFLHILNAKTQEEIFERILCGFYPENSKYCLLAIDMEYLGAGKVKEKYEKQLKDLASLTEKHKNAYSFIMVDPRRKNIFELMKKFIEEKKFTGIKLYPAMGYYPFDKGLDPIYGYAEKNNIPIITHCSRGIIYYKGKVTNKMLIHPKTGKKLGEAKRYSIFSKRNRTYSEGCSAPENYYYVLKKFPNLKLSFGHFGGDLELDSYLTDPWNPDTANVKSWYSVIKDLIRDKNYPNVYADISYSFINDTYFPLLKVELSDPVIRKRILFGTDFHMPLQFMNDRAFGMTLRGYLGEKDFKQIANKNPKRFLRR